MADASDRIDLDRLRTLVHDAVRDGADTVEDVHLHIAKLPFDVIEQLVGDNDNIERAKGAATRTIGAVYDILHTVNDQAASIAERVIGGSDDDQTN